MAGTRHKSKKKVTIVDPIVKTVFAQIKRQYRMNYPIKFYPISKGHFLFFNGCLLVILTDFDNMPVPVRRIGPC
jgi:hypothetical protein